MAADEMHAVMYKVLAIVYSAMREERGVSKIEISAEALGIGERYWADIMAQLVSHGYLCGVTVVDLPDGSHVVRLQRPCVTMEGVQFAKENSMMGKAKKALMEAKAVIPYI